MMKKRNIVAHFSNLNNFISEFEPFASSPPAPEDSFFYIRYPKPDVLFGKTKLNSELPTALTDQQKELSATYNIIKDKDWSKHTKPCQDVLHGIAPINTSVNSMKVKPKPAGIDDGFKGEGAACGSSVVKMLVSFKPAINIEKQVAHQMIQRSPRGFTVATPEEEISDPQPQPRHLARRGSKSLPATPLHSPPSSPTSRRRMNGNRYFTSPFEPVEDTNSRSWLTMALLGFKKDLTGSTSTLAEEDAIENRLQVVSLAESVENLGPSPKMEVKALSSETANQQQKLSKPLHTFRPKPSELREMNFWSPTSM